MRDALGAGTTLGYCTNVHPGTTLDRIRANLDRYAVRVRERLDCAGPMGVGLWLPADVARALRDDHARGAFRTFLDDRGLLPFTVNGFPQGDFHDRVIKHRVYRPDWTDATRRDYTIDLVHVLAGLLEPGDEGSISTLPLGWPTEVAGEDALRAAATHLRAVAAVAARVESETGVLVHVDVEPEPGCTLGRTADVVAYFEEHLLGGPDDAIVRRHLRACHDICHAAVMFEEQADAFARYDAAGIGVGKVQISAAVRADFDELPDDHARATARDQLAAFGEDRYLHQVVVRAGGTETFYDDLPAALASAAPRGAWRVHYHVPVDVESFGLLRTTADAIGACLDAARAHGTRHYEVETYAWSVLPPALATDDLAAGLARELAFVTEDRS